MVDVSPGAIRTFATMALVITWSVAGALPAVADNPFGYPPTPFHGPCPDLGVGEPSAPQEDGLIDPEECVDQVIDYGRDCALLQGWTACTWASSAVSDCINYANPTCEEPANCLALEPQSPCGAAWNDFWACWDFEPGTVCHDVDNELKPFYECAFLTPGTPCADTVEEAESCVEGSAASACRPVHDCVAGQPAFPCDPNPQVGFVPPAGCQYECESLPVQEFVIGTGEQLPDTYLLWCDYHVLGTWTVPYVAATETEDCPLGGSPSSSQPLTAGQSAPEPGFAEPIKYLTRGFCDYPITLTVYDLGVGGPGTEPLVLPCAFLTDP